MKKITKILLCLTLFAVMFSFGACDKENNVKREVNSVNHRGYFEAPENTLSAYRLSALKGFEYVETDVSFTKDGVPVLLHDNTVDRTTNGSGRIGDLTLNEVSELDFGSWKDEKYAGEKVPLFTEFIALCKELNLHPYIEIKNGATAEEICVLADAAEKSGIEVTWIARSADYLVQIYNMRNITENGIRDRYGLIVDVVTQGSIDSVAQIEKSKVSMDSNYMFLTGAQIRLCKRNEVPLEVWTLDNESQIANIDPYISGVTSNKVNASELFSRM